MKHSDKLWDNYALAAAQARQLFLGYDASALSRKLRAPLDEQYLYPRMLGEPYRICRSTGEISRKTPSGWVVANSHDETMVLLDLVCDSREDRHTTGRFQNMGDFGIRFHQTLLEQPDPWAARLQSSPRELERACTALGGQRCPMGDAAFALPLFEELRVVLQLWYGDEEFPTRLRWLWDENALQYLKYETMYFAVSLIRTRINALLPQEVL